LVALFAGAGFGVRPGVGDVGVDAERGARGRAHRLGDRGDVLELRLALDVEPADFRGDRLTDLAVGLADAGVNDLGGRHARLQGAEQLAAGDDIHPRAVAGQRLDDV